MSSIIQVENIYKKFILRHEVKRSGYSSLRDVLTERAKKIFGPRELKQERHEEFWALKDLSFEVNPGDRLGIIGRNGAGKSTLLKILSRITEPTSGSIRIRGRVASLLEVGTGFHPELTGRENIFLNGAILGMSRQEVRSKFDEIVAFAEVERFLDTPVKRYSSGMYVRLAFAVAAHLEPEILIVDEVLAVGDAQFQKKCLGKMRDVSENYGRTLLFVSHNMAALGALCNRGIVLGGGQCRHMGDIQSALNFYNQSESKRIDTVSKFVSATLRIDSIEFHPATVVSFEDIRCTVRLVGSSEKIKSVVLVISKEGRRVGIIDMRSHLEMDDKTEYSELTCEVRIKAIPLVEGEYVAGLYLESTSVTGDFDDLANFVVLPRASDSPEVAPYSTLVRGTVEFQFNASIRTAK